MNIDDIYTPEKKGKVYEKANYNPLLDELIQNIDEGGERPDFMQMIRMIESNDEHEAKASTLHGDEYSAKGVYQFTNATVKRAKQRALNLGIDQGFVSTIPNDPTMWNDKEADVMFLANMFAATMKEKGLVDNLLEKAFAGDRQAMQDLYYKVHHTGSKEDKYYDNTKARVEQFMPLEI